ncbi:MAG: hypothetical protein COU06_02410 [Candidatus Harrisonbacteria bacterium CG10_big_fil_rev_8_21_14_0_10_38_8]|uniref:DUF192 domain-containing protein n=1 Tax=Candidatus Harrisonbacteria bacterium CG10_big_fil_rev_8_21_14_0_10_38_8 TaxID=1974582 RepID=A0A2M6WJP2_9BACT|nr:MAG: hypothetical protein COU06_02410 [Candidatus Harrisonbacteria bacterium CG10_big_fil_rev_8_21_14_0_10_38_8]
MNYLLENKTVIIISLLVILAILYFFWYKGVFIKKVIGEVEIVLGENTYQVEVAKTPQEQVNGLSNRELLEEGKGMLFIFDRAKIQSFWMKDMNFSIDIVWLNDNKVIGFTENLLPATTTIPTIYQSNSLSDMVLELNAGVVKKDNIRVGDILKLN